MRMFCAVCLSGLVIFCETGSMSSADEFRLALTARGGPDQLDEALNSARTHRKSHPKDTIVITLPEKLSRKTPIKIGPQDSGTEDAPLIFRGRANGGTTITGAVTIESEPVTDPRAEPVFRMPRAVWDKVRRVRMGDNIARTEPAFSQHGSFQPDSPGRLFVFEGNRRLEAARWPSVRYANSPVVVSASDSASVAIRLPEKIMGLDKEPDLWIAGYWGANWWFEARKVSSTTERVIGFSKPDASIQASARYFLFNVASGLDRTGMFYREASDGSLYYVPNKTNGSGRLSIPTVDTLLQISGAANVRFEYIAFEKTIGPGVTIENSTNVVLRECYVGHTGTDGIVIIGGQRNHVERCVVDDTGYDGISVAGGDRRTLTPGAHILRDNLISHFGREMPSYRPGIHLHGVGNPVQGCEIANGPHSGILFDGNDHHIIGNLLHDLVLDTNDAGAIYSGRNWTVRGTEIVSNYFYDINNRVDAYKSNRSLSRRSTIRFHY